LPEGDTVYKLAAYLDIRLRGRRLAAGSRVAAAAHLALRGRTVERVVARGKHLWVELDHGPALRSHLGMHGSWHRYAPGEPWQRDAGRASIVLVTGDALFVCFDAMEVEAVRPESVRAHQLAARLGPDLAVAAIDVEGIEARARAFLEPAEPLADVLLDQRVAAGIGNVYKSEVLFLCRIHPRTALGALTSRRLRALYETAHACLRRNLGRGPRSTRWVRDGRGRLWVYRRGGLPCLGCGTRIATARLGRGWRSTYWCPDCQPEPGRR
jgi:endonuclease-8